MNGQRLSLGLCWLLLGGCVSFGNAGLADREAMTQIKAGETTREQVIALLGEPDSKRVIDLSGATFERWSYRRSSSIINIWEGASGFSMGTDRALRSESKSPS